MPNDVRVRTYRKWKFLKNIHLDTDRLFLAAVIEKSTVVWRGRGWHSNQWFVCRCCTFKSTSTQKFLEILPLSFYSCLPFFTKAPESCGTLTGKTTETSQWYTIKQDWWKYKSALSTVFVRRVGGITMRVRNVNSGAVSFYSHGSCFHRSNREVISKAAGWSICSAEFTHRQTDTSQVFLVKQY